MKSIQTKSKSTLTMPSEEKYQKTPLFSQKKRSVVENSKSRTPPFLGYSLNGANSYGKSSQQKITSLIAKKT